MKSCEINCLLNVSDLIDEKPLQELRVNSGFGGIALRCVRIFVMVHVYEFIRLKGVLVIVCCHYKFMFMSV